VDFISDDYESSLAYCSVETGNEPLVTDGVVQSAGLRAQAVEAARARVPTFQPSRPYPSRGVFYRYCC
jgi:hypothetical protein